MCEKKTKVCSKCKIEKPLTEYHKSKKTKTGVRSFCKKCRNAYEAEYRENNPEKVKASRKKYRENNREKVRASQKRYEENNPEKIKAYRKEYVEKNREKRKAYLKKYREESPEKIKASRKKYEENNPEKVKASRKKYRDKNPEKFRLYAQRRRAKIKGATTEDFTDQDLFDFWIENGINYKECFYCEKEMPERPETWDHYIAIDNGGPHERANLLPCCKSCNSRKHAKDPEVFMEELKNGV